MQEAFLPYETMGDVKVLLIFKIGHKEGHQLNYFLRSAKQSKLNHTQIFKVRSQDNANISHINIQLV